ncbi:division abnormally delayed protein [Anthonomus grandis grandis]|uniref:division abnormally delayed protein n=1 Tax=Anthonomus grandis grandis TaxID=2921223 RepID=UPI002165195C|nr:division abnormally delayed protein [Anthonomus grandis grandis]
MAFGSWPFTFLVILCIIGVTFAKNVNNNNVRNKRQLNELNQASCDTVMPFFQSRNITVPASNVTTNKGLICGGQCCDNETELLLKEQGRKDFAALLRHNSRSLLGPINRTSTVLQNHVWELAHQSENKTLVLFSQVYRTMSVVSHELIENLYKDIRDYLKVNSAGDQIPSKSSIDIKKSVDRFFTNLFPLAYHQQSGGTSGDFTDRYKQCLKDNIDVIAPFGDVPQEVAESLSKSLEATRLLIYAFSVGIEVLSTTDSLILDEHSTTSSECQSALLKMTYCPKCLGLTKNSKPCEGLCLNVLRGCISKYVAELDLPWNSYLEGIEGLVNALKKTSNDAGVSVDVAIKNLDMQISSAIMYSMERMVDIDKKVKITCKIPEFLPKVEALTVETATAAMAKARQPASRSFPHFPDAYMTSFLSTMSKTKGFYADLADNLCGDESFAEQRDKRCWNGERIAEYSKTVVGVGMNVQKYNPEVKAASNLQQVDPKISSLVDKLRHVHHMALSSLGPNYIEPDYMMRDGFDGSGSGNDSDDDDDDLRGSGSGNGPIVSEEERAMHPIQKVEDGGAAEHIPTVHKASSSTSLSPRMVLTLLSLIVAIRFLK